MIIKSLFYIIICTAALAFNSCECFSDSVKTEVTSFTTNQHTQFITDHYCYGAKYLFGKNQGDYSWFDFKAVSDSCGEFMLHPEDIMVTSSMGDTIPFGIRINKRFLTSKTLPTIQVSDTTEVGLTFCCPHTKEDRRIMVFVNHFPEQQDYTVFSFDVPSSDIEIGRKKKNQ